MRNKVYTFQPKGKGYNVYATKTYHGKSSRSSGRSSSSSRSSGGVTDFVGGVIGRMIATAIFGKKR